MFVPKLDYSLNPQEMETLNTISQETTENTNKNIYLNILTK